VPCIPLWGPCHVIASLIVGDFPRVKWLAFEK
jgi:hypothetical protein